MSRDRAAYMRAYRAKDRGSPGPRFGPSTLGDDLKACREENERLTEDAARLKREVAELRGELISRLVGPTNVDTSSLRSSREAQARRDEILRRINRTK